MFFVRAALACTHFLIGGIFVADYKKLYFKLLEAMVEITNKLDSVRDEIATELIEADEPKETLETLRTFEKIEYKNYRM